MMTGVIQPGLGVVAAAMAGHVGPALRRMHLFRRAAPACAAFAEIWHPVEGLCGIAPSSVTAFGRDTSCPRCGIRFPGPLGHGNRAAALLCPRFFRHRRRFGHSPPGGRLGACKKRPRLVGRDRFLRVEWGWGDYRALGAVQRSYSTCMTVATVWRP